jgi:hypothetical protein
MSSTIATLAFNAEAPTKLVFQIHRFSPAEYDDNGRDSSPCPSLVHSVATTDTESEAGYRMVTAFHVPGTALGFPIHVETKGNNEILYSAGGDASQQAQEPHDAHSLMSNFSDDGRALPNRGSHLGRNPRGGGGPRRDEVDGPEGPSPQSPDHPTTGAHPAGEPKGWACPYRKHNPLIFNVRDYNACSHLPFSTLVGLKYVPCSFSPLVGAQVTHANHFMVPIGSTSTASTPHEHNMHSIVHP